jgi:cell wall-associated NlpC family hydrolase
MHLLKFILLVGVGLIYFVEDGFCQTNKSSTNNNGLMFIEDIQFVQKRMDSKLVLLKPILKNEADTVNVSKNKNQFESNESISSKTISSYPPTNIDNSNVNSIELCTNRIFKYGQILNIEVEKINNDSLYQFIDNWLGTPYHFGGTSSGGIDCSGFTGKLHKTVFGVVLPRMAKDQYRACKKIESTEMKQGDLVFFNTRGGVSHVGVYLINGYFVHASTKNGVVINNLKEGYYKQRFIGAGRVGEVEVQ